MLLASCIRSADGSGCGDGSYKGIVVLIALTLAVAAGVGIVRALRWGGRAQPTPRRGILVALLLVWIVASGASATAIGYTNADAYHDEIQRAVPWAHDGAACRTWEPTLYVIELGVSGLALAAGMGAVRFSAGTASLVAARVTLVGGCALIGYWALVFLGDSLTTCST